MELTNLTTKDIEFIENVPMSYSDLVEEGKSLINAVDLFKLKIAKLAVKACTIRHGGRSSGYYTLSDFAKDIGVDRKKLSDWVLIYRRVVVPANLKITSEKDWNIAARVSERIAKENTIIRKKDGDVRSKFVAFSPDKKLLNHLIDDVQKGADAYVHIRRYLSTALNLIKEIKTASIRDKNILLDINEKSQEFVSTAMSIQDHTIRLIENMKH